MAGRPRATVFGEEAHRYDRARPSYPSALIDDLVGLGGRRVLDVGCGTGKVARLFAERGCSVLGIEPDPRMASIARSHGIEVVLARFEDWSGDAASFDLVVAGQAWHWVDPEAGASKAADLLDSGGSLALFWNHGAAPPEVRRALDEVYGSLAPDLVPTATALGATPHDADEREIAAIDGTGRYDPVEIRRYEWRRTYSAEAFVDRLQTHSDHILMNPSHRERLLEAVRAVLADFGSFDVSYATNLILAAKSGRRRGSASD